MSMFDNIVLDEFTMLDEGEQAEKYLSNKREKKYEEMDKDRKYTSASGYSSVNKRGYGTNPTRHVNNNPAYDRGKSLADLRTRYNDVMPSKKSKSEEKYEKALKTATDQATKAEKMADKAVTGVNKRDRSDWGAAYDAAKRHQRRHPKTESALALIDGYESEFAY